MLFRRKRRRNPNPDIASVYYIVLFVAVIGFANHMRENRDAPQQITAAFSKSVSNIKNTVPPDVRNYSASLFPDGKTSLSIQDIQAGKGGPTVCGQTVTIAYVTYREDNTQAAPRATKEAPLVFRIGEKKVMPALEQGMIGMQVGGTRNIFAPSHLSFGISEFAHKDIPENAAVRFEVELLETAPALPDLQGTAYRFMETRTGLGPVLPCGSPAQLHLSIRTADGRTIYASRDKGQEPITVTPGKSEYFMGLEQAVIGMRSGGIRSAIVPPSFQKTMYGNPPVLDIPFPEGETVLVDIESVP
jgi:peptidylprolyl isomerase